MQGYATDYSSVYVLIFINHIKNMQIEELSDAVNNANAIRRIRNLQPIGGKGDYVSPPTYLDNQKKTIHVFEKRRIDDNDVVCVLLDSVQSQANRFEECLLNGIKTKEFQIPNVEVNFQETSIGDIGIISTLNAPHRIFDAIIRDSEFNGKTFLESNIGKTVGNASPRNATGLFQYAPTTLLFGGWNSTGKRGGSGNKFQRCIVSEIIGIGVPVQHVTDQSGREQIISSSKKPSSRLDPLQIERMNIWLSKKAKYDWSLIKSEENKPGKPSDVVHGNIPPLIAEQGITMEYARQTTTITLAGLRHLHFPDSENNEKKERNSAAWMVLTSIALCAITQQDKYGYSLRSRCDLCPEKNSSGFEIIHNDGDVKETEITFDDAKNMLKNSVKIAKENGLEWETEPVQLVPQEKLVDMVVKSRKTEPAEE